MYTNQQTAHILRITPNELANIPKSELSCNNALYEKQDILNYAKKRGMSVVAVESELQLFSLADTYKNGYHIVSRTIELIKAGKKFAFIGPEGCGKNQAAVSFLSYVYGDNICVIRSMYDIQPEIPEGKRVIRELDSIETRRDVFLHDEPFDIITYTACDKAEFLNAVKDAIGHDVTDSMALEPLDCIVVINKPGKIELMENLKQ